MATLATTPRRRPLGTEATKTPRRSAARSRPTSENLDPNLPTSISSPSPQKRPPSSACKPKKPLLRSPILPSLPPERKFIVVKKNHPEKKANETHQDRQRAAYDSLRASQDVFFKHQNTVPVAASPSRIVIVEDGEIVKGDVSPEMGEVGGTVKIRKMRNKLMEEAMTSLPEQGCGMVLHLVKAFENILSISKNGEEDESQKNADDWALPGLRMLPPRAAISTVSCSSSGEFFGLHGDSRLCASLDGSIQSSREGFDSGASGGGGGRRSRRNSSDSMENRRKKLGVTNLRPFKLRTEQRGRLKEEYFLKKVQEMLMEEEKRRIPQAQGLPWTTDEPECLVKPVVKEATEPADIFLHSDIRAVERAEFDQYVSDRIILAERKRLEREKHQRLEEEEQVRQMRKELVPRAQPMPYFDKPFVPKRSERPRTIPREPRFRRVQTRKPCE